MAINFLDASATAGADGLHIPVADLPGVLATDLASGVDSNRKHCKFLTGLLESISTGYDSTHLGFYVSKSDPKLSGDKIVYTYTVSSQLVVDTSSNLVYVIPVPTAGANTGVGDFAITDYLAGATAVLSADTVGAGVVIPWADLNSYGVSGTPTLGTDDRLVIFALIGLAFDSDAFPVRAQGTLSSISGKVLSGNTIVNLPASAYAAVDPTSDLNEADKDTESIFEKTYKFTLQLSTSVEDADIAYV